MLYTTDINIYVAQLATCVRTATDLMKDHAENIEPWKWHRFENMNAEINALTKTIKEHCKEVVE